LKEGVQKFKEFEEFKNAAIATPLDQSHVLSQPFLLAI
jgi:hypothetical protein